MDYDLDIMPENEHLSGGRFAKSAVSAGCSGKIMVRSRMITAISDTKYRTKSGAPITLVSLHGKDDVLVLGPAEAIERIANGEIPEPYTHSGYIDKVKQAIKITAIEITYIKQLPNLFNLCDFDDPKNSENMDIRCFFRAPIEQVKNYFSENNMEEFCARFTEEAEAHLGYLSSILSSSNKHPYWWLAWEDFLITSSGRHIMGYPISYKDKLMSPRKRNEFEILVAST